MLFHRELIAQKAVISYLRIRLRSRLEISRDEITGFWPINLQKLPSSFLEDPSDLCKWIEGFTSLCFRNEHQQYIQILRCSFFFFFNVIKKNYSNLLPANILYFWALQCLLVLKLHLLPLAHTHSPFSCLYFLPLRVSLTDQYCSSLHIQSTFKTKNEI